MDHNCDGSGIPEGGASSSILSRRSVRAVLLAIGCAAVVLPFLGARPVHHENEALEATYARQMLATGDWILPHVPQVSIHGQPMPDKPPLTNWTAAFFGLLRGGVIDELGARLPTAFWAVVCVVSVYLAGAHLFGERAGLASAALLVVIPQFIRYSRYGRVDMCLLGAFAAAMAAFLVWLDCELKGWARGWLFIVFGFLLGLAVLAKGPLALVLFGGAAGAFVAMKLYMKEKIPLPKAWAAAASLAAFIVPVSWYFFAYLRGGYGFLHTQLLFGNTALFLGKEGSMGHTKYVEAFLMEVFPWSLFFPLAVWWAWKSDRQAGPRRFLILLWAFIFLFFTVSAYKRRAYLMPILIPTCLLLGDYLTTAPSGAILFRRIVQWLGAIILAVASFATLAFVCYAGLAERPDAARVFDAMSGFRGPADVYARVFARNFVPLLVPTLAVVAFSGLAIWGAAKRSLTTNLVGLGLAMAVVSCILFPFWKYSVAVVTNGRDFAFEVEEAVPPSEEIKSAGIRDDHSLIVSFYMKRVLRRLHSGGVDVEDVSSLSPGYYILPEKTIDGAREWEIIRRPARPIGVRQFGWVLARKEVPE